MLGRGEELDIDVLLWAADLRRGERNTLEHRRGEGITSQRKISPQQLLEVALA
jgi:hypothetical protein